MRKDFIKKISGRTLAWVGIALYILRVLTSATDLDGNSTTPSLFVFSVGIATFIFIAVVVIRLWSRAKITSLVLVMSALLAMGSGFLSFFVDSSLILLTNVATVVFFLSYFYAIFLLFKLTTSSD